MGGRAEYRAVGTAVIAALLGLAAWRYGLFFDADAYDLEMGLFAAGTVAAIWSMGYAKRPVPPIAGLPLAVAACYGLALLTGPESVKGTVDSLLRWIAYAGWFSLLAVWWRNGENRAWGEAAVHAAGVFALAGGWLGWFGWISFTDIVLRFQDPQLSATGARLAGFLQYPNAYGAVLAFFLLRIWQIWSVTCRRNIALFTSVVSVPYAGALVLTESRGSVAALLLGLALAFAVADSRQSRVRLLLAAGWTAAGAWAAARGALGSMNGGLAGGWLTAVALLAGGALLYGLWIWLRKEEAARGNERRAVKLPHARPLLFSAALWAACMMTYLLSGGLGSEGRISGNYGTAASRLLFYRDGFRMFRDSPWLGFGGDSWRTLFGFYQSQPYVGGEVHSGYLEILLDVGLLGAAVFAAMMGFLIWRMWRVRRFALAPAAVLLIHAAFDFDLSFAWIWLLLLAWFALFTAEEEPRRPGRAPAAGWIAAALLTAAFAAGAWAAWHGIAASRAVEAADAAPAADTAARAAHLRAALEANPAWTRIRVALAPLLPEAQERESVLAAGLRYEPQSAPLMLQLGLAEAELGRVAQAEARLREALRLERYSRDGQTAAIAAMTRTAEELRWGGRGDDARKADEAAVSFFENYRGLVAEFQAMRKPVNGKRFAMTSAAEYNAAQSYAALGRKDEARSLLRNLIDAGDENWSGQARQLLDKLG